MSDVLTSQETEIECADGIRLRATEWRPGQSNGWVVQINSALAVQRRYYSKFAHYLAEQGFSVVSYDYRGIGDSLHGHHKQCRATFRELGECDMAAATAYVKQKFPHYRHVVVGHSAGAALYGLAANCDQVDALLGVAAPSAFQGHWSQPHRFLIQLFFNVCIPLTTPALGYFPGQYFGMGPLPREIALQWRRWSTHKDYVVEADGSPLREHYHRFRSPLRFLHIADDPLYGPLKSVQSAASFYANAPRQIVTVAPRDVGLRKIGHFGFFRSSMPQKVWDNTARWLLNPQTP